MDLFKIAEIIYSVLFKEYPLISLLYGYFKDMAKLMSSADLPIEWVTPSGLILKQHYLKASSTSVLIRLNNKVSKTTMKTYTDLLDRRKQKDAIIPNITHSLDANHLMNVLMDCYEKEGFELITIHDCFGSHPNNMDIVHRKVKEHFVNIYSNINFIELFHNHCINILKSNNYNVIKDKITNQELVEFKDLEGNTTGVAHLPCPPKLGKFDLSRIHKARYTIN